MRLDELIADLPDARWAADVSAAPPATAAGGRNTAGLPPAWGKIEVSGLAYDSREVRSGDIFVCWEGYRFDGHDFVADALQRGAAAVVTERPVDTGKWPQIMVPNGREALARLAAAFYGHPSRRMRLIGVTGTNGKTTTTYLTKAVLEAGGHKVGLIGTIRHLIGDEVVEAQRTTPESLDLQRILFQMAERGMDCVVMEVSSHAVALHRTLGCEFDLGIFTNITQDHLDFHASFEGYLSTKASFFADLGHHATKPRKAAIINHDDAHCDVIAGQAGAPVYRYGTEGVGEFQALDVHVEPEGLTFTAKTPTTEIPLRMRITGRFNVYNSLAALAAGWHEGVPPGALRKALEEVEGVAGRLQRVDCGQDFTVIVDYAHTPDSLENVLRAARGIAPGRVLVVFGCGGDRDRGKRPLMGEVAARFADHVIVTSDNPRSENPAAICRQVEAGVLEGGMTSGQYDVIVERREAIAHAIGAARPRDLVLIAGKGHETYQIFHDRTIHFDDREEAARALRERLSHGTPAH